MKNTAYRVEKKYIVTDRQLALLGRRLSCVMRSDVHQHGNHYDIRSLYFDDASDSFLHENAAGVDLRKKYRIRLYNPSQTAMHLECKKKVHGFTQKTACTITKDECISLMGASSLPLAFDSRSLLNAFLIEKRAASLAPKAIIQYERTAFVSPLGNVRITFDRNITASACCREFFAPRPRGLIPLLPDGLHVLEVKYDELIPDYLLELVQSVAPSPTAFSKYYLGRRALHGDFSPDLL